MGFRLRAAIVCGLALGFAAYFFLFSAPSSFPQQLLLPVRSGETGGEVAQALKIDRAIRSEFIFKALLRLFGSDSHIVAGTYYFARPQNAFTIAWRLRIGNFDIEPTKVTIPEGTGVAQMAVLLKQTLPTFDSQTFLAVATPQEGYLFPDTYFFYPGESMTDIVQAMRNNFDAQVDGRSITPAIISMASLLEKEAPDTANRKIISGILWKRLSLNMPLQVDAVFPFITGKPIEKITRADYAVQSPYNTYIHTGLPPGPITNPGLDSIDAALNPTSSSYLYYLSDSHGVFHYSTTLAEQVVNEKKYLK